MYFNNKETVMLSQSQRMWGNAADAAQHRNFGIAMLVTGLHEAEKAAVSNFRI